MTWQHWDELMVGDRVHHPHWGLGNVTARPRGSFGWSVVVKFHDGTEQWFDYVSKSPFDPRELAPA